MIDEDDGVPQDNGRMLTVDFKRAQELGRVDDAWACARCGLFFKPLATVLLSRAGQTFCTNVEACAARTHDLQQKPCPFCGDARPKSILENISFPRYETPPGAHDGKLDLNVENEKTTYAVCCPSCAAQGGWAQTRGNARRNWDMRK